MNNDLEDRLIELEIRSSFQEQKLLALNDAMVAQQQELDRLQARLQAAERRIAQLANGGGGGLSGPVDEKPPHY